jgi:hypothetical protein
MHWLQRLIWRASVSNGDRVQPPDGGRRGTDASAAGSDCSYAKSFSRIFIVNYLLIDLPQHTPCIRVGVFRTGELAARKRDEHGRVLAVAAILVAELLDQIALFQLDADQNLPRHHHREQQMTNGHRRRGPDGEQDAEIDRVTDMSVEQRRAEFRVR